MQEVSDAVVMFADRLREILEERGLSGRKLAAMCSQPVMTINDALNARRTPRWPVIVAIADALDISTDEFRPPKRRRKKTA